MVDSQIALQFQPYLRPGERITWTGRPPRGVRFTGRDVFLIPFSLLWGGFAIFWEASVLGISFLQPKALPVTSFMALFGAVFVLIGLFMIFGRFLVDAWIRQRTVYALTDRRALSLRRLRAENLLSADLREPRLSRSGGDVGTLTFSRSATTAGLFGAFGSPQAQFSMWIPSLSDEVVFAGIPGVTRVYQLAAPAAASP